MQRNERDWAGQLVGWLKSAIDSGRTSFQDVTNDTGIVTASGRTKFPDILLFVDKTSGVVFNGWELKFPDTPVDDPEMLINALEKAKALRSESFVTWNGAEAVIWRIDTSDYSVRTLSICKAYPKIATISCRDDMADIGKYLSHEDELRQRAYEILHDLGEMYRDGGMRPALNISGDIIQAIRESSAIIIPQFQAAITERKGESRTFRDAFNRWKIYENATLCILQSSSRRGETVLPERVLAKFTFYNLIGKILFYLTLSDNLPGELDQLTVDEAESDVRAVLERCFAKAKQIDYQAIFQPYFTDDIAFSDITNAALVRLLRVLTDFDFRILPSNVIGTILENLVPADERQKFGQYFTPDVLSHLVAFAAVKTRNDVLFDPTSGTGSFLNAFYDILSYHGRTSHADLLGRIWGNDISHFPAILSVINLYKKDLSATENFPRVLRGDFFNLTSGATVRFPSACNHEKRDIPVPLFDGIASNFPFIQQEDIPNDKLADLFKKAFQSSQKAFLKGGEFKINERSDYFTYCVYQSVRFLKPDGCMSVITSNAWLGKEYGFRFKRFLMDNFHIKYVVRSNAEHWFRGSQVSTIFTVLERGESHEATRFVTLNVKLEDAFRADDARAMIRRIEDFYADIDTADDACNRSWTPDEGLRGSYRKNDGSATVCVVEEKTLRESIDKKENWSIHFVSSDLYGSIGNCLTQYYPRIIDVFRGERTGWNKMFVVKKSTKAGTKIAEKYLLPYVKSTSELSEISFEDTYRNDLFVCCDSYDTLDEGTKMWIDSFKGALNRNNSKTIEEANASHKPYWYSLKPKTAHIVTSINPYERYFFSFSRQAFAVDQRLVGILVRDGYDVELIAALLNSAITFLIIEMHGTSRHLGALDLNANYFKQIRFLDPDRLSDSQKEEILRKFEPLKHRRIGTLAEEIRMADRIDFDTTIMRCYSLRADVLPTIYDLLSTSVYNRISMKNK